MENMQIWEKVARVPKEYLKKITGGRLSGKSDISPQWRLKVMTELFGPCGVGWKYEVENRTTYENNHEVGVFVDILLYIKVDGEWSAPIPGTGGAMLVSQETKGLYFSDEAYKMATTDALSVAMKQIGVGADIYLGLWDGSKYTTKEKSQTPPNLQRLIDETTKNQDKLPEAFKNDVRAAVRAGKELSKSGLQEWLDAIDQHLKAGEK